MASSSSLSMKDLTTLSARHVQEFDRLLMYRIGLLCSLHILLKQSARKNNRRTV